MLTSVLLGTGQLAVAGQQPKYGVSVRAAKPAALAKAKTYVWTESAKLRQERQEDHRRRPRAQRARLHEAASGRACGGHHASAGRRGPEAEARRMAPGGNMRSARWSWTCDPANKESLFRVRMDTPIESEPEARGRYQRGRGRNVRKVPEAVDTLTVLRKRLSA